MSKEKASLSGDCGCSTNCKCSSNCDCSTDCGCPANCGGSAKGQKDQTSSNLKASSKLKASDCGCSTDCKCSNNCECSTDCGCSTNCGRSAKEQKDQTSSKSKASENACECSTSCNCASDCECPTDCGCSTNCGRSAKEEKDQKLPKSKASENACGCSTNCECSSNCECPTDCGCSTNCGRSTKEPKDQTSSKSKASENACGCSTNCECSSNCECPTDCGCSTNCGRPVKEEKDQKLPKSKASENACGCSTYCDCSSNCECPTDCGCSTNCGRSKQKDQINWGIIGCGSIAAKWARAIQMSGHCLYGIASRSQEHVAEFAREHNITVATTLYGDYTQLVEDENIHAVLITVPTTLKMEWVIKSLQHNKHVIMEKPHVNAKQVREVLELASSRGLQLMDGVMFMHAERLKELEQRIFKDSILGGPPTRVMSMFSDGILPRGNIRLDPSLEPLGSLADLGTYSVRITLWAFEWELPDRVRAVATSKTEDALTGVVGWMLYDDGRVGTFDANNASAISQWAHISSSSAVLKIPNFVVPQEAGSEYIVERSEWKDHECLTNVDRVQVPAQVQESHAITTFSDLINKRKESSTTTKFWGLCALKTQLVLDALMQSVKEGGSEIVIDKSIVDV